MCVLVEASGKARDTGSVSYTHLWHVAPGEQWHGFSDADAHHMFLDPVKVTILTPGMDEQGNMSEEGIPAALVAKFLRCV